LHPNSHAMKRILICVALAVLAAGCSDDKKQEKLLLDTVIKIHDKLMADDGVIMKNKMALKPYALAPATKDSVAIYTKTLSDADDAMMGWMNKFSPDFTEKSHEQIMVYLHVQKAQILKLDSQINNAVAASNQYLTKIITK
jgi:hypothetical protein